MPWEATFLELQHQKPQNYTGRKLSEQIAKDAGISIL